MRQAKREREGEAKYGALRVLRWNEKRFGTGVLHRARPWRAAWEETGGCVGWHLVLEKKEASASSSLSGVKLVNGGQVVCMALTYYARHASPRARSYSAHEVTSLPLCGGGHSRNHY